VIAELVLAVAVSVGPTTSPTTSPTTLDGVKVQLREGTQQVVTVNYTDGYRARVTFWKLTDTGWRARFSADDGRIGYGGLVRGTKRKQGTGTTPLGTYALPWAFGMGPVDDRWKVRYRQVESGDFWVQDNESAYYNRYRNQAEGGFRWWLPTSDPDSSERLTDFRHQYRISVVTDFNIKQVRHRGAGIFLHVNGDGATAGCVSAPGVFMDKLMRVLDPARVPVIAVGR
jgi:L,D-peptidoglycan transpeptidase YkuD (ErfK/YbiS/YcfS/YnhG family)